MLAAVKSMFYRGNNLREQSTRGRGFEPRSHHGWPRLQPAQLRQQSARTEHDTLRRSQMSGGGSSLLV
jgi:hypothetical protein